MENNGWFDTNFNRLKLLKEIKPKVEVKNEAKPKDSFKSSDDENEWQQEYELIYLSHKLESN